MRTRSPVKIGHVMWRRLCTDEKSSSDRARHVVLIMHYLDFEQFLNGCDGLPKRFVPKSGSNFDNLAKFSNISGK